MSTTYQGKVGRLPAALREEVNRRLERGDTATAVAGWLNGLPEVLAMLAAEFHAKPVRKQNVCEWRRHGYQEWLRRREAMAMAGEIGELQGMEREALLGDLAGWASVRYLMAVRRLVDADGDCARHLPVLREFCRDVVALRRGEYVNERLKLKKEQLELREGLLKSIVLTETAKGI